MKNVSVSLSIISSHKIDLCHIFSQMCQNLRRQDNIQTLGAEPITKPREQKKTKHTKNEMKSPEEMNL